MNTRNLKKACGAALLCLALALAAYRGVPCLFRAFLGVPCPGCGMTRAVKSLAEGDWTGAWRWHPMVYSMPLLGALLWRTGRKGPWGAGASALVAMLGVGLLVCWLFRAPLGLAAV